MYQMSEFKGIIKSLSYKYPSKDIQDKYDVEQELSAKLYTIWPTISDLPRDEVFRFVKTALNNHTIDLIRKSKTQAKYNVKLKLGAQVGNAVSAHEYTEELDLEEVVINSLEKQFGHKLDQFFYSDNAENMLMYKDLRDHLVKWSDTQDEKTQTFIKEFVCPSDDTLDKWSIMVDKNPAYKQYAWIPPYAYSKILDISRMKIYRIVNKMRSYLTEQGYAQSY